MSTMKYTEAMYVQRSCAATAIDILWLLNDMKEFGLAVMGIQPNGL
jgi:hypothetical protein